MKIGQKIDLQLLVVQGFALGESRAECVELQRRERTTGLVTGLYYDQIYLTPDGVELRIVQIADTENSAILIERENLPTPAFDTLKIGQRLPLGDQTYEITEIERFQLDNPALALAQEATWVWLQSRQKPELLALVEYRSTGVSLFCGIRISTAELARIFI